MQRYAFRRRRSSLKGAKTSDLTVAHNLGTTTSLSTLPPEDRRKVPPAMQHADDFDSAVSDPEENHMRSNDNRPQTGQQLVPLARQERIFSDPVRDPIYFSQEIVRDLSRSEPRVICPNVQQILVGSRRPDYPSSPSPWHASRALA